MGSQVFVSQTEPSIWVEKMQSLEKIEAFSVQPPSSAVVSTTGQVVDDCVNIGANGQTEQPDVISDITNIGESRRVANVADAAGEPGAAGTAA